MSLREDFRNYFCSTYVGVRQDGKLLPFKIEDVIDNSDFGRNDYSDEHKAQLRFIGYIYNVSSGRSAEFNISVVDERLVLETPEIGYWRDQRGRIRWVRYRASRNRLKGIHGQKIVGLSSPLSLTVLFHMFNPTFEGLVNKHLYISPITGVVYYKGVAIGKRIDNRVNILPKWQHINSILRDFEVHVVDAIEFPAPRYGHVVSQAHSRFDNEQEALGEPTGPFARPFEEAVARPRRRVEPVPELEPDTHSTGQQRQRLSTQEREERDRQRGHRDNGMPVPMANESFSSFSSRLDAYFESRQ